MNENWPKDPRVIAFVAHSGLLLMALMFGSTGGHTGLGWYGTIFCVCAIQILDLPVIVVLELIGLLVRDTPWAIVLLFFLGGAQWALIVWLLMALGLVPRLRPCTPGHCWKCDYDLTGNTSGVCPECGAIVRGRDPGSLSE